MRRISLSILTKIVFLGSMGCLVQNVMAQSQAKFWVYFTDKGSSTHPHSKLMKGSSAYSDAAAFVQPRALARRAKVLPAGEILDYNDVSVNAGYIRQVISLGGILKNESRWLNAASFILTPSQITSVSRLPFVKNVAHVAILHARKDVERSTDASASPFFKTTLFDYGPSAAQVDAINVPQLHELGITGMNVLVGMLDSGFRWRGHESLQTRHVIAEHDFIWNRDTTANGPQDSDDQDEHGTLTFSTLGGYMPGQLIGPAFNADFILAKTEYVPITDYKGEEDNWAAGIEWEESYGVDVVSSSLGYNTFVDTADYTWDNGDFNGRTTVSAQAAVRAARLGVVVCDAMGNEQNGDGVTGTLLTPADADSIISVGALTLSRTLPSFQSTGPTNDGRIKPDLTAPGVHIYCANHSSPNAYFYEQGTSLSTPLTAGSAALVLSARPELTPMQVIGAFKQTADTALTDEHFTSFPNNFEGWGLINAFNAALTFGPIFGNKPVIQSNFTRNKISITVISKFGIKPDSVLLYYTRGNDPTFTPITMSLDSSMIFTTSGRYVVTPPPSATGTLIKFYVEARDSSGKLYRSPAPYLNTLWSFNYGEAGVTDLPDRPDLYHLVQNFPNPFNPSTTITVIPFTTPTPVRLEIAVFNILGQRVRTLFDGQSVQNLNTIQWDGNDEHGLALPSGVYLCRMVTPFSVSTTRMMILR